MSEIIGTDRDQPGGNSPGGKPPAEDEPKSIKLVMILALAGLISGVGIVGIYEVTLETITANKARELRAAVFKVLPGVTQMQQLAQENNRLVPVAEDDASDNTIYGGYDAEQNFIGYAIPGAGPGFQDTIKLLYGYLPESKKVVGMEVLESRETPGLGDKIYKDLVFVGAFADLPIEPIIEVVKKGRKVSDNQVDAITGATISSRAVVKIINDTNSIWLESLPPVGSEPAMQANTVDNNSEDYEEFSKGVWRDNPVFVQVLGMCPMLAVTNSAVNAVAMGGATLFVLVGSSFLVSIFKNLIPKQIRISCFIIIIATFVTIADYTLLALIPTVHKELGAFIPLIVANCMILGRQEAFASKSTPRLAVMDALGMSTGFMIALLALGGIREILGTGTLFGVELFGPAWEPWVIMILPPGGFLTLGLILLFFNWFTQRKAMFLEQVAAAEAEGSSQ